MRKIGFIYMSLMLNIASYSQPNYGGTPLTYSQDYFNLFIKGDTSKCGIALFVAPKINNDAEKQKANATSSAAVAGIHIPVDIDLISVASMRYLADSSKLYLMKVISSTASRISVFFDNFYLPLGARLFFYNAPKTKYIGSFTHKNNNADSTFHTQGINGDTIFIEYYQPKNSAVLPKLHIYCLGHEFS